MRYFAICSVIVVLAFAASALADDIEGQVTDAKGNPVSGVVISAGNPPDKTLGQATTDADGRYMVSGLNDGTYYLKLDPAGTPYKGQTVVSYLDPDGLNVNWKVSDVTPAVATATKGSKKKPGAGYLVGAAAGVAAVGGGIGTAAAVGAFSGGGGGGKPHKHPHSPSE